MSLQVDESLSLMNLFVVSNIQHLILAQIKATSVPGAKALVIWHMPGCANIVVAMRQILIDDLWETVVVIPENAVAAYTPQDFDFSTAKRKLWVTRAAVIDAQNAIDSALGSVDSFSHLYICNTTGRVDRRIWSMAKRRNIPVCAIEDGLKSYLTAGIYERDKRSFFRKEIAGFWRYCAQIGLDRFALSYSLPFSKNEPLAEIHLLFPEAASDACKKAGRICDLSVQLGNGAFEQMLAKTSGAIGDLVIPSDAWLYLSRSDSEDGFLTEEQEVSIISSLLRDIPKTRAGLLFIKPHPRDRKNKIDAILARTPGLKLFDLDFPLPIELLAGQLRFSAYFGTWSGPLVYLPLLHQVKTFTLLPIFIERAMELGCVPERLISILSSVRPSFEKEMMWVDTVKWRELLK